MLKEKSQTTVTIVVTKIDRKRNLLEADLTFIRKQLTDLAKELGCTVRKVLFVSSVTGDGIPGLMRELEFLNQQRTENRYILKQFVLMEVFIPFLIHHFSLCLFSCAVVSLLPPSARPGLHETKMFFPRKH